MIKRDYKRDVAEALHDYRIRAQFLGELLSFVNTPIPNNETDRKKLTEEIKNILEKGCWRL